MLHNVISLLKKVYFIARPYGRKKLLLTSFLSLLQGLFQVIGVTSVFPFLAYAASPETINTSKIGKIIFEFFPKNTHNENLILLGSLSLAVLIFSNVVNFIADYNRISYYQNFAHWLRIKLIQKITSQNYTYLLNNDTGILAKKVNSDVTQFALSVLAPLLDLSSRLFTAFFLICTLVYVEPVITLSLFLAGGLFYTSIYFLLRKKRHKNKDLMKNGNRGTALATYEVFGGIKPISVHNKIPFFIQRFAHFSNFQAKGQKASEMLTVFPRHLIEPLAFGSIIFIVLIYAAKGQDFVALLPSLGVMGFAGYRLLPCLNLAYLQLSKVSTMKHALEEVYDEFSEAESLDTFLQKPTSISWDHEISFQNIFFKYPNTEKSVIDNLNLTIHKNSKVAFIGSTGSGKSTLVDCLLGLHKPTSGSILIDDQELNETNLTAWRSKIGYVPQEIFLFNDSIAANIALGIPKDQINMVQVKHVAQLAQVADFIETELPQGYDTEVGERGVRLSGGQRQRIGLARAFYHKPEILILDEATSALDNETEKALMQSIDNLEGNFTIIIIAHRLTTIQTCDKIYQIDRGITRLLQSLPQTSDYPF